MCVHHAKNYQSSLLTLHIRLVRMFMTLTIIGVVYSTEGGVRICRSTWLKV